VPEGEYSFAAKIRAHGSSVVLGATAGNCNEDGRWAVQVSCNSPSGPNMYDACFFDGASGLCVDYNVFHVVAQ
jgi:hypothetical protein